VWTCFKIRELRGTAPSARQERRKTSVVNR
jgi:hypothetical protein